MNFEEHAAKPLLAGKGLVDVRSPREFSGELLAPENLPQEGAQRGGHVPGAVNIPWDSFYNADGTVKSAEEIRNIVGRSGVTGDKEVVTYCTGGIRSSWLLFTLKLAGFEKIKNYAGSWMEWSRDSDLPIER